MINRPAEKRVVITSIDGLYNEKAKPLIMNINDRRLSPKCLVGAHTFINASLDWVKENRSISLKSDGIERDGETWYAFGQGYGGMRYCSDCKKIDCIHYWESETSYQIKHSNYESTIYVIGLCRFCELRILRFSCGESSSSPAAQELIKKVAVELGRRNPWESPGYGSGWVLEFPATVSNLLETKGTDLAEAYVRGCFLRGSLL